MDQNIIGSKLEDQYSNQHEHSEPNEKTEYLHGKKRKYGAPRKQVENTSLWQQYPAISKDRSVLLKIINQPEIHHRARYQTEGSRGAIKDKTGTGYPSVVLKGYNKKTLLQIYIGCDSGKIGPHLFYQACKVTGKNATPCKQTKIDGTDVIQVELLPGNINDTVVCDCVGILKERYADVEQRFPKHRASKSNKKKSTKCRIVFRTTIENCEGNTETLQVISDVINCTQVPGTPEILKMSTNTSSASGGGELWIIGKNFLKETKIMFTCLSKDKSEKSWTKIMEPDRAFYHPTHIITKIPPFRNTKITENVEIHIYVKCDEKFSDPHFFTYSPIPPELNGNLIDGGCFTSGLPQGVSIPAVRINQQFAATGTVCLVATAGNTDTETTNGVGSEPSPSASRPNVTCQTTPIPSRLTVRRQSKPLGARPTILEHLDDSGKKYRMELGPGSRSGPGFRRTRSVPRPTFICEDTMFDWVEASQADQRYGTSQSDHRFGTSLQMSPWGLRDPSKLKQTPTSFSGSFQSEQRKFFVPKSQETSNAIGLFNADDESNSCNFTRDSALDESSVQSTLCADVSTELTTDFSDTVAIVSNKCPTKSEPSVTWCTMENKKEDSESLKDTQTEKLPDVKNSNISYKTSNVETATISISLPQSILHDTKHLETVIQTINKTLLNPAETTPEATSGECSLDVKQNQNQFSNFSTTQMKNINWSNTQSEGIKDTNSVEVNNSQTDQTTKHPWTDKFSTKSVTWIDPSENKNYVWKDSNKLENTTWSDNMWIQNKEDGATNQKWPTHSVNKMEEVKVGAYVDGYIKGQEDAKKKIQTTSEEWKENTSQLWHKNEGEKWQPSSETKQFWNNEHNENNSEKEWMEEPIAKKTPIWTTKSENTNWINPVINQNDWQDESKIKSHDIENGENITMSQFAIPDSSKVMDSFTNSTSSTMCQKFKKPPSNCINVFEESALSTKGNPLLSEASSAIAVQQDIVTKVGMDVTKSSQSIEPQSILQDWCFSENN